MRALAFSTMAVASAFACAPILGIDDIAYGPERPIAEGGGGDDGAGPVDGLAPCNAPRIRCGTDCVAPADDPKNCGSCGFHCGGGSCVDRKCRPVVLVSGLYSPHGLAVDRDYVYATLYGRDWPSTASVGSVIRFPTDGGVPEGGAPETIASGLDLPSFLRRSGDRLVWTSKNGVTTTLTDGGNPIGNPDAGQSFELVLEGSVVYSVQYGGGCAIHAWRLPGTDGGPLPPPRALPCGRWVASDGERLYASIARDSDAGVAAFARDGSGAVALLGTRPSWATAVEGDYVYYSEELSSAFTEDVATSVRRVLRDGGGETVLATGVYQPRVLVVDPPSGSIYVGEFFSNQISRIPIDGGVPTAIATTQGPVGLVLVDGFLYWAGIGTPAQPGGQIGRIRIR